MSDEIQKLASLSAEEADMSKIIGMMNHKGGCAKSSLTDALAHRLVARGYIVLVADNDPQGNVSARFGLTNETEFEDHRMNTFYEGLKKTNFSDKLIQMPIRVSSELLDSYPGALYLLPSHSESEHSAYSARSVLGLKEGNKRYRDRFRFYGNYFNYTIIDTGPAIHGNVSNEMTINAVDDAVIPFDGSEAVAGLNKFINWAVRNFDSTTPNAVFAMTKYQCDTLDILRKLFDAMNLKTSSCSGERCCGSFRIMKNVLGNHVCDTGIPERRVLKNHTYDGLSNSYDIKRKYDKLSDEIIGKISVKRENVFELWQEGIFEKELETLMMPLERGRHSNITHQFTATAFEGIAKVKSRFGLR